MIARLLTTLLLGLLAWMPAVASAAASSNPTEEEKRAAQKMFEAGDGLYESGRYEDAIAAFKNSHDLVGSPNSRLMLARSLREAGRSGEACEQFRGTIRDAEASGGRYPEALQAAQSELKALESLLAAVELSPTLREQLVELKVNDKPTSLESSRIPVVAGKVKLSYRLKDGSEQLQTIEVTQGENKVVDLEQPKKPSTLATAQPAPKAVAIQEPPPPPASSSGAWTTAAWISAGVGVAGLSAFGVFGYLDRKAFKDLEAQCSGSRCPQGSQNKIDEGRRYQTLANVSLAVAAVGVATAATLFVVSPRKKSEGPQVALGISATGLMIDGHFE